MVFWTRSGGSNRTWIRGGLIVQNFRYGSLFFGSTRFMSYRCWLVAWCLLGSDGGAGDSGSFMGLMAWSASVLSRWFDCVGGGELVIAWLEARRSCTMQARASDMSLISSIWAVVIRPTIVWIWIIWCSIFYLDQYPRGIVQLIDMRTLTSLYTNGFYEENLLSAFVYFSLSLNFNH